MINRLYKKSSLILPLTATILALIFAPYLDIYFAFIATSWLIFGLLGMSLDIVWGRGGFLSLGQTVAYGLGGYFGSVLAINMAAYFSHSLFWALLAGALGGAMAAALLGVIIFYARMGALQSTVLSYTFTLLLWTVSQTFKVKIGNAVIGGDNGLSNIPGFIVGFGENAETLTPNQTFAVVALICSIVYFVSRYLLNSHFGRIIDCIRIDVQKTELLGYDVRKYQLLNFVYAGGVAGIAGAMFGLWANYLNPSIFSVQEAMLVPIFVLVGGLGTLSGAFVGALLIGGLSFWLGSGTVGGQTTLILGGVLIILVMYLKNGILGSLDTLYKYFLPNYQTSIEQALEVKIDKNLVKTLVSNTVSPTFRIENLLKKFGGVTPVNNVSYQFKSGRPYALIGPNGAGKTSLLKTSIGLYIPDGGEVFLAKQNISKKPIFDRIRMGMGVKNQKPQLFGELSIEQNLWMAAYGKTRDDLYAQKTSKDICKMLGFEAIASLAADKLSHGQKQWLDIGLLLCLAPDVMFFDEPAAGMTAKETEQLTHLIGLLARHSIVIVVEHNMDFVASLDAQVIMLHQGSIYAEGALETLRQNEHILDLYLGRRGA